MVSFFGLKFGADKKRKGSESKESSQTQSRQQQQHQQQQQQWKRIDQNELGEGQFFGKNIHHKEGIPGSRPSTAHSTRTGSKGKSVAYTMGDTASFTANSMYDLSNTEFRGIGSAHKTGSFFGAGARLKPYASDANLKLSLGSKNMSSTSLAAPSANFGGEARRPGSSQSMRHDGKSWVNPLDVHFMRPITPLSAGPPRSPLGQFELKSPLKSDTDSLLGDDAEKVAEEISAKITREEEQAKAKAEAEQKAKAQAELEAQAKRYKEATMSTLEIPAPPRYGGLRATSPAMPSPTFGPGPRLQGMGAPDLRPGSRGQDRPANGPRPAPSPRFQRPATDETRSSSRGRGQPPPELPLPSPVPRFQGPASHETGAHRRNRSRTQGSEPAEENDHRGRKVRPRDSHAEPHSRDHFPMRAMTVSAVKPPRSPLFPGSPPFDSPEESVSSNSDDKEDERPIVDPRALNAPYGIPSPPLSNGQRSSEETDSRPVIRNVKAKRDTMVMGGPRRQSLEMQIEQFEKSLMKHAKMQQQIQQQHHEVTSPVSSSSNESGRNSAASSHYSDMSESPIIMEPALMSPKPFPLSPRPQSRSRSPPERPRPKTAGAAASAPLRRPTLDEYGPVKLGPVASLAGRLRRPSPDEYGVPLEKRAESPVFGPSVKTSRSTVKGMASNTNSRPSSPVRGKSNSTSSNGPFSISTRQPTPPSSIKTKWDLGPAPTPAPTAPLPLPEKSSRRDPVHMAKVLEAHDHLDHVGIDTRDTNPSSVKTTVLPAPAIPKQQLSSNPPSPKTPHPERDSMARASASLAPSPSIVPNTDVNPNWPLPAPGPSFSRSNSPTAMSDASSTRRAGHRGRRAPPAPLNIAATKYADDMSFPGDSYSGPWTPDLTAGGDGKVMVLTPVERPKTAGGASSKVAAHGGFWRGDRREIRIDREFELREERSDVALATAPPLPTGVGLRLGLERVDTGAFGETAKSARGGEDEDASGPIGMARGLSIRNDRSWLRERERVKAMGFGFGSAIDEEAGGNSGSSGPSHKNTDGGEPFDRLRRPNHGLRSPTGIADESGTRFI